MDPCFREVNSQVSIDLHPSKLRDVAGSVRDQLCALLLTFREELCGVVLAFSGARIETRSPLVHAFFPYFHVDVSAKLQVLRLEPAQRMGAHSCCPASTCAGSSARALLTRRACVQWACCKKLPSTTWACLFWALSMPSSTSATCSATSNLIIKCGSQMPAEPACHQESLRRVVLDRLLAVL